MQNIVIFADYGLDDAAATVSIFNSNEKFESITIVPIGGNVPAEISFRNCYTLLSYYPEIWHKIKVVNTCHIKQPSEYLADIHGKDGMGDLLVHTDKKPDVREQVFEEWIKDFKDGSIVLSLGPMTLVRTLLENHSPRLLVLMGGVINTEPNFNGYEFNQALDADAFNYCVKSPHVAITLDTCRTDMLDMEKAKIEGDDLHSRIIRAYKKLVLARGEDGCRVWDDVAACYILYPERYEVIKVKDPYGNIISNANYISDKLYFEKD